MLVSERIDFITKWIKNYANKNKFKLVIGVSGGIDSAVTSVLCARTNIKTIVVSMPIRQDQKQHNLSLEHIEWLLVHRYWVYFLLSVELLVGAV